MQDIVLNVALTLQGPVLTKSTAAGRPGVDAPMARDWRGRRSLPGTLIKGKLREAWTEMQETVPTFDVRIDELLGRRTGNRADGGAPAVAPHRGRLRFSDFEDERPDASSGSRYRIRIDPELGSVAKGAYQVIEAPYKAGERVVFRGTIRFVAADGHEAGQVASGVERGLRWITALGAARTIGFGRLLGASIEVTTAEAELAFAGRGDMLPLALTPESPFCVAARRITDNLFESQDRIPGGVLKGAFVSTWMALIGKPTDTLVDAATDPARPDLCQQFDKVRFTHAFPAPAGSMLRPVQYPLSVVQVRDGGGSFYDVALSSGPGLIRGEVPDFDVDWKNAAPVRDHFGIIEPKRELRIRTAIDPDLRRAAEHDLFAYEAVVPEGCVWLGSIDLGLVPTNRDGVRAQLLEVLRHGLRDIGKTKASATVALPAALRPKFDALVEPIDGSHWVVTLQTPAILTDPDDLRGAGDRQCKNAYNEVWRELSGENLELVRLFARQELAGGFYLHRRFQSGDYYPYLLTSAGSVFVLRATGDPDRGRQCVREWWEHGLRLPAWARERFRRDGRDGDDWRNCPYIRENGYGEIAVNLPVHVGRNPQTQGVYDVIPESLAD